MESIIYNKKTSNFQSQRCSRRKHSDRRAAEEGRAGGARLSAPHRLRVLGVRIPRFRPGFQLGKCRLKVQHWSIGTLFRASQVLKAGHFFFPDNPKKRTEIYYNL